MYDGRITRLRLEAEGSTVSDCQRALDEGVPVVQAAIRRVGEMGGLRSDEGPLFSETTRSEDVYSSRRDRGGGIRFVGRRVVAFEPDPQGQLVAMVPLDDAAGVVEEKLDLLREVGGLSITPLVARTSEAPRWRVYLSLDDDERTFDGRTLYEAASSGTDWLASEVGKSALEDSRAVVRRAREVGTK